VLRITERSGLRPIVHAQNKLLMYDFPARGGIETLKDFILPSSISWNADAISRKNKRESKNSLS
jgi:hypothetical protein